MFEFGRYRLSYEPPEGSVEAEVEMIISSEATLTQMIELFEGFLKASGYVFEGGLEVVASDETLDNNYWKEKYLELMQVVE